MARARINKEITDIAQSVLLTVCGSVLKIRPYIRRMTLTPDGKRSRGVVEVFYSDSLTSTLWIASTMKDDEKRAWAVNELEGYKNIADLPQHRFIKIHEKKKIKYIPITSSVPDIEDILRNDAELNTPTMIEGYNYPVKLYQLKSLLDKTHYLEIEYASKIVKLLRPPQETIDILGFGDGEKTEEVEEKYNFAEKP